MTSDAIFDLLNLNGTLALGGVYRLRAKGGVAEVEITDTATGERNVVYVQDGRDIYITMPVGHYRVWLRTRATSVSLMRLGFAERIGAYATKAVGLMRSGRLIAAVAARMRRPASGISGMAIGEATHVADLPSRPALALAKPDPALSSAGVSIVIPTKIRAEMLRACVDSLALNRTVEVEIIIVDNGAEGNAMVALLAELSRRPDVKLIRDDGGFNFSRLCNEGAAQARYPLLLFLNDDIEALDGDWLAAMRDYVARPDVGAVGARLLYTDRTLQHAGVASNLVPGPGHPWRGVAPDVWQSHPFLAQPGDVDAVTGACLMMRRDVFDAVGGFDAEAFSVTLNDVDLCLRVREQGLKIVYAPDATLLHKEGQSRRRDDDPAERARRQAELRAYVARHPEAARRSVFYPLTLRRDTDQALSI
ncbi:glycosyl transferase family 2 family protein [Asticcacaulis biprosthecium C19]|uniref:Glycosyl transferase family 2 family protein n=1 Tax=Asticcacaulis biprosthecium C19 TaxID=715226 RepID=F4QLZ4_9CAUL|nr:glycosyltransferase family 2 protein [Asticcacaulis biprosthecium]EGF93566.1 glycosyl transferase family 2 family protein [Asticcacaulis biprosthecium C19]